MRLTVEPALDTVSDRMHPSWPSIRNLAQAVEEQRRLITHLTDLATRFMALDHRPFLMHGDGTIDMIGPSPVPTLLTDLLRIELERLRALERGLHEAIEGYEG